jgi:hypothetical protein
MMRKRRIFSDYLIDMGKTYRHGSDDGRGSHRKNIKKGKKRSQGYTDSRYDTPEETESEWEDYSQNERNPNFEKFSKNRKKR